jgi:molecular chaperone DnaJ
MADAWFNSSIIDPSVNLSTAIRCTITPWIKRSPKKDKSTEKKLSTMAGMIEFNPYQVLDVGPDASLADIKQAYRQLAKQFHPDSQHKNAHHDRITQVNAAYALLKDPRRRQAYDDRCRYGIDNADLNFRQQRTAATQDHYRQARQARRQADDDFKTWVRRVYTPVNREIAKVTKQLKAEITALAADPYDDELMGDFQLYLEDCRAVVNKAQQIFKSMPNPSNVAGVAAHLYYCLNHMEDGLTEFEWFTQSYEDSYLASGKEMFRKSTSLRREAQAALKDLQAVGDL